MALDFVIVSEFDTIKRRGFEVSPDAGENVIDPNGTNPLVLGEFLEMDNNYRLKRGTSTSPTCSDKPSWPAFVERGRTDTQALNKVSVFWAGQVEFDTKIFSGSPAIGDPVGVVDVTVGGLQKRGLKPVATPGGTEFVVGYVTRLPSENNGYLRVLRLW